MQQNGVDDEDRGEQRGRYHLIGGRKGDERGEGDDFDQDPQRKVGRGAGRRMVVHRVSHG